MATDTASLEAEGGDRVFRTTHWSVVLAAGDTGAPDAHTALTKLCETYWYPLYCPVVFGAWSPEGDEIITASEDGRARVWEVAPATEPFEELQRQAELLSAHRLQQGQGMVPLTTSELRERWQARPAQSVAGRP